MLKKDTMKYLVKAKLIPSRTQALLDAVANNTLGMGSVAFGEYVDNMQQARLLDDGSCCWLEVCFCNTPLNEELPYWQQYFSDIHTENALDPRLCQDANGESAHACLECRCTRGLEEQMRNWGKPFLASIGSNDYER